MKQVFHPYWRWECYKAGFYNTTAPYGFSKEECILAYKDFLSDLDLFELYLKKIISTWKYSCEHFLTKKSVNKIAYLGQASVCLSTGIPSKFRTGFTKMNIKQQKNANRLAEEYYKIWKRKYLSTLNDGKTEDIQMTFQMLFQAN